MTSFIISNAADPSESSIEISKERYLEYTDESRFASLFSLSDEAIESIKSWPCLITTEGRSSEIIRLVKITSILETNSAFQVAFQVLPLKKPLTNGLVWKERHRLGLEEFEFNRYHWTIKTSNIFEVLLDESFVGSSQIEAFPEMEVPSPIRSDLIAAKNIISEWSHTEIDDFLLEAGVVGLNADRSIGSRHDRVNTILRSVLKKPWLKTAENRLFSSFMIEKAGAGVTDQNPEANDEQRVPDEPVKELGLDFPISSETPTAVSTRVFVVHGRNDVIRNQIVTFLSEIGLDPIVLHEQANMGRHLLTKFIDEADLASFAVVIMTNDDEGGLLDEGKKPRARQNVIFELGYFIAHLGQRKVCALISPGLETPSDFDGIVYVPIDEQEDWKKTLHRELAAVGIPVKVPK